MARSVTRAGLGGLDATMRQIGRCFVSARTRSGLTQVELARRCGITQATLSRLEQGTGNVTVGTMEAVAEALDLRLAVALVGPGVHVDGDA